MTENDVERASMLMKSRDAIECFLECRDLESSFLKHRMASNYENVRNDAKKTPGAAMAQISIMDADSFEEEDADTLESFDISRDVLERALTHELDRIAADLAALGIKPTE